MAKTTDFILCQQYLINYVECINQHIGQCKVELNAQSALCPITPVSFERIDCCLREFVDSERKYLSKRNQNLLNKFKDDIEESKLYESIRMKYSTNDIFNQFIEIRQKQAAIWEEQQMLETRILCQFLPPHFDALERFISPVKPVSLNDEQRNIRLKNERLKVIQEAKRKWLHAIMMDREMKLQDYDSQYQHILQQFKSNVPINAQETHNATLNEINRCMMQHTNRLKQDIAKRMFGYQRRIQRNHRRSSGAKNMIGVSPEPYLDLKVNPFNAQEWNYLKLGMIY